MMKSKEVQDSTISYFILLLFGKQGECEFRKVVDLLEFSLSRSFLFYFSAKLILKCTYIVSC